MNDVSDVYTRIAERELGRLVNGPYQHLEYIITMHYLQQYLPPSGLIIDVGGGPGRYARDFCRQGRDVVLCDLAPGNIALARQLFADEPEAVRVCLQGLQVADVRSLPYPDGTFTAALCLGGPLSHIPEAADRSRAMRELYRVVAPGGLVVLTGIGKLAVLRTIMAKEGSELMDGSLATFFSDGNSPGPERMLWHWFRAQELRELAESHGLTTLIMAGCESLSTGLKEATNTLYQDKEKWRIWYDIVLAHATEPAVVDMAEHILYFGRKGH
jgi:SAM-dependent methyltransferase